VIHRVGPGAHQAHLTFEHIDQLGQLIERPTPQKTPDRGDARIVAAGLLRRLDLFLALSLLVALYDSLQAAGILLLASGGLRRLRISGAAVAATAPAMGTAMAPTDQRLPGAPTIAVIIPAWNEAASLGATLESVLAQIPQPERVIVCDDGSSDDTLVRLAEGYGLGGEGRLRRSRSHPNLGLLAKEHGGKGDSINQGVAVSSAEVVLILDADTELLPGALAALEHRFALEPGLDAVSGTLLPHCPPQPSGAPVRRLPALRIRP
jgi:hypothetical protein